MNTKKAQFLFFFFATIQWNLLKTQSRKILLIMAKAGFWKTVGIVKIT